MSELDPVVPVLSVTPEDALQVTQRLREVRLKLHSAFEQADRDICALIQRLVPREKP